MVRWQPARRRERCEGKVFRDAEVAEQIQLLTNERHTVPGGVLGMARCVGLAVQRHLSGVGLVIAAENIPQRGLARAVFSNEAQRVSAREVKLTSFSTLTPKKFLEMPRDWKAVPGSRFAVRSSWLEAVGCMRCEQLAKPAKPRLREALAENGIFSFRRGSVVCLSFADLSYEPLVPNGAEMRAILPVGLI